MDGRNGQTDGRTERMDGWDGRTDEPTNGRMDGCARTDRLTVIRLVSDTPTIISFFITQPSEFLFAVCRSGPFVLFVPSVGPSYRPFIRPSAHAPVHPSVSPSPVHPFTPVRSTVDSSISLSVPPLPVRLFRPLLGSSTRSSEGRSIIGQLISRQFILPST